MPAIRVGRQRARAGGVYPRVQPGSYAVSVVTRTETSRQVLFTVTER